LIKTDFSEKGLAFKVLKKVNFEIAQKPVKTSFTTGLCDDISDSM